ncbi:MAG: hypothetical protein KBB54_04465 [Candidatus Pacebacteria bacterium]|nr:hypothetical protein [Candidatus Paceibacterota bacterium]MBP9819011.1 hypothetical protein [Candidatus Paceibacterota bacterium]
MIFYIFTLLVFVYTWILFCIKQHTAELVKKAEKSLGVTHNEKLTGNQKASNNGDLQRLKDYILFNGMFKKWVSTSTAYRVGFIFYTIVPLVEGLLHNRNFWEDNSTDPLQIFIWKIMSLLYCVGFAVSLTLSIRKLQETYCTDCEILIHS